MSLTWKLGPAVLVAMLLPAGTALALPWNEDMRNAPSIKPQEAQVFTNKTSVPASNDEPYAVPESLSQLVRERLQAGEELSNPVANSQESLDRGKELYDTHCLVCHGTSGQGDGPVGQKFLPEPMNLQTEYVQQQKDGQLFYTITHGGVVMPIYRQSIRIEDRWHIVNYVKNVLGQGAE